jgi:flagellar hook-associated protein 3 FlgL
MTIARVSDAGQFLFVQRRTQLVQVQIRELQEQIVSGRRLLRPEQDPLGAGQVVRHSAGLTALAQYDDSAAFGVQVLAAQDDALDDANSLLVRAEELASQFSSGIYTPAQREAAREEVHGLLQGLTSVGNSELAGRRLWSGLGQGGAPPFADPDATGYDPATAYTGSTYQFEVKVGGDSAERVRVSTPGGQVFTPALQALQDLETALGTPTGDVAGTLDDLAAARDGLASERASVGGRQAQLQSRIAQVRGLTEREATSRAEIRDADFIVVATQLAQANNALQALLAAASQIKETSLTGLLRL